MLMFTSVKSSYWSLLFLTCLMLMSPRHAKAENATDLSQRSVRSLLSGIEFKEGRQELIRRGEKAFPALETILSDKEAMPVEIARIFVVLRYVKSDRSRFVKHAIRSLKQTDPEVRWHAVWLLEYIGTTKEARQVYELVSDSEMVVMYAAIKTTGAIGGPLQLANLNGLMKSLANGKDADLYTHVKKHHDQMKERLDALEKTKK